MNQENNSMSNHNALIGYSGFVGSVLLRQSSFSALFRSNNIDAINGEFFHTVVCSAAPAQKWLVNRDPASDLANIEKLIHHLKQIECEKFVLISTVDVFKQPMGVNESSPVDEVDLHAYGLHRRLLEKFVQQHFKRHLIIRLPGLVGPGLRKNVIYDFLNDNNLHAIDSRGIFQFYPMVNLWYDIQIALSAGLSLVHLTAAPIQVSELALQGFNRSFIQPLNTPPAIYDMRTEFAHVFNGAGDYQYSQRESLQAIRAYAQSEPKASLSPKGVGL